MKTFVQSPLNSLFGPAPGFPVIRQTPVASWPSVLDGSTIPQDISPVLNKVYFTKKELKQTVKRYDHSRCVDVVEEIWEIPFSVDVDEPVTELTQRIQAVMTAKQIYRHWDINFSNFTILAKQEIRSDVVFEIHR